MRVVHKLKSSVCFLSNILAICGIHEVSENTAINDIIDSIIALSTKLTPYYTTCSNHLLLHHRVYEEDKLSISHSDIQSHNAVSFKTLTPLSQLVFSPLGDIDILSLTFSSVAQGLSKWRFIFIHQ